MKQTITVFAAGVLGAALSLGATWLVKQGTPNEIRARSFVLVNSDGVPIGEMGESFGGGSLTLYTEDGAGRVMIWSSKFSDDPLTTVGRIRLVDHQDGAMTRAVEISGFGVEDLIWTEMHEKASRYLSPDQ